MKRADLIPAITQAYNLEVVDILPVQKGYRNESHVLKLKNGYVNLIIYKTEDGIVERIHNANETAQILFKNGLPVRVQCDPRIVKVQSGVSTQYGALYNYLPGSTISWEAYTKDYLRSLGLAMATMHHVLRSKEGVIPHVPQIIEESMDLAKRMIGYFLQPGVVSALKSKLQLEAPKHISRYVKLFDELGAAPNQQLLHMDFVRGNVLFSEKSTNSTLGYGRVQVSGIIDFEKTAYGPVVFDIARTLAFLLVDTKYKTEAEVRRYFLNSGYIKHGKGAFEPHVEVSGKRINLLEVLIDFYLLYDLYKFLLHNPYESLPENEHYTRTISLLKQRGRVMSV